MKGMMIMGGYEDKPVICVRNSTIEGAPEGEFEIKAKVKLTNQHTPVDGPASFDLTVIELMPPKGVTITEKKEEKKEMKSPGDAFDEALDKEDEEDSEYED